jgi:hypothetical protein
VKGSRKLEKPIQLFVNLTDRGSDELKVRDKNINIFLRRSQNEK